MGAVTVKSSWESERGSRYSIQGETVTAWCAHRTDVSKHHVCLQEEGASVMAAGGAVEQRNRRGEAAVVAPKSMADLRGSEWTAQ